MSNAGVVCGFALAGKRPIYVMRYQGFAWYNFASILNYAAKSKTMWNTPCPVFVRCLAMEGSIGPVAGNVHHGMAMRMPGVKVYAPMTPSEWERAFSDFLHGDDPVICSEHRLSYGDPCVCDVYNEDAQTTVLAIGASRITAVQAAYKGRLDVYGIHCLKPLLLSSQALNSLQKTRRALIVDGEHETCGAAEHVAFAVSKLGVAVDVLGLPDRTAGFGTHCDNLTPSVDAILGASA